MNETIKTFGYPETLGGRKGTLEEDLPGFSYYYKIKNNDMGVEHIDDIKDRLGKFISKLSETPEKAVLIVGHDIAGLILRQMIDGRSGDIFKERSFSNAQVVRIGEVDYV